MGTSNQKSTSDPDEKIFVIVAADGTLAMSPAPIPQLFFDVFT
jgi:hypothetical protein